MDINRHMAQKIAFEQMIQIEIQRTSKQMSSIRRASSEDQRLVRAWADPLVLREVVEAGIGDWLRGVGEKAKSFLSNSAMKAWEKVRGTLGKFRKVFQNARAVKALSDTIGEITPDSVKRFLKEGQKKLKKVFKSIQAILVTKSEVPTLTDLIKRTVVGAKISDWFNDKVRPKTDAIDEILKKYTPTLRRIGLAAIFTFIWLNVDELSWEWADLVAGFTGAISTAELLASLPESSVGLLSGMFFGIGYTIMPYMIAGRLLWLMRNKYVTWDRNKYKVNWSKVDKERFENADRLPEYRQVSVLR